MIAKRDQLTVSVAIIGMKPPVTPSAELDRLRINDPSEALESKIVSNSHPATCSAAEDFELLISIAPHWHLSSPALAENCIAPASRSLAPTLTFITVSPPNEMQPNQSEGEREAICSGRTPN